MGRQPNNPSVRIVKCEHCPYSARRVDYGLHDRDCIERKRHLIREQEEKLKMMKRNKFKKDIQRAGMKFGKLVSCSITGGCVLNPRLARMAFPDSSRSKSNSSSHVVGVLSFLGGKKPKFLPRSS